jgi:hypothetical protein
MGAEVCGDLRAGVGLAPVGSLGHGAKADRARRERAPEQGRRLGVGARRWTQGGEVGFGHEFSLRVWVESRRGSRGHGQASSTAKCWLACRQRVPEPGGHPVGLLVLVPSPATRTWPPGPRIAITRLGVRSRLWLTQLTAASRISARERKLRPRTTSAWPGWRSAKPRMWPGSAWRSRGFS